MPVAQEEPPSSRPCTSSFVVSLPLVMAAMLVSLTLGRNSEAQTVTVLHTFTGASGDGYNPSAPVIAAPGGTLYGTAYSGGDLSCTLGFGGCGVIFEEAFSGGQWTYSTIHEFNGVEDGCCQSSTLTRDRAGRLYGVTTGGSFGKIFRLTASATGRPWHFEILYTFQDLSDGEYPLTPLFIDGSGTIYGVTPSGSLAGCPNGCGAVFQIVPPAEPGGAWTENTLYQFTGASDGGIPDTMIMDRSGVIYGTTNYAGVVNEECPSGCGVVFRLAPSQNGPWIYSVLFTFNGHPDGNPYGSLFEDANSVLYGLAFKINAGQEIFKLTPPQRPTGNWTRTVAYSPKSGVTYLTAGERGVLYGVETGDQDINAGSLFQLTPQAGGGYTFRTVINFSKSGPDRNPNAVLVGPSGTLYDTMSGGSSDGGMVISVQ
jgi:hypothetical protein